MKYDVAIIGCGYVGLTLAAALSQSGVKVLGVDPKFDSGLDKSDLGMHEPGVLDAIVTTVPSLSPDDEVSAYVICVATPLADDGALERATREVAAHMPAEGATVVIRSTVRVGTTRNLVAPILNTTGKSGHLAYCPERTVEGNALAELRTLPQILGTDADLNADKAARAIFNPLGVAFRSVPSFELAETAKLLANSWRDVTFAYANEVARICEANGVSAQDAIDTANWNYPRCAIPRPGPVGGPCLTKDSLLLASDHEGTSVIKAARTINQYVTFEIWSRVNSRLFTAGKIDAKIAVLGTAFKGQPATTDTRDAPSAEVTRQLRMVGYNVATVDPVAPADHPDLWGQFYDAIIIMTNNPDFLSCGGNLKPGGFIYDAVGLLPYPSPNVVRFGG